MRIKLDENLGRRGAAILRAAGHQVTTVAEEGLSSTSDEQLAEVCRADRKCLVTLDLDFSNPLRFTPSRHAGIAVLRLPDGSGAGDLLQAVRTLAAALAANTMDGKLWIVQRGHIREYQERGERLIRPRLRAAAPTLIATPGPQPVPTEPGCAAPPVLGHAAKPRLCRRRCRGAAPAIGWTHDGRQREPGRTARVAGGVARPAARARPAGVRGGNSHRIPKTASQRGRALPLERRPRRHCGKSSEYAAPAARETAPAAGATIGRKGAAATVAA